MADLAVLVCGLFIGDLLFFFRAGRKAEIWFSRVANHRTSAILICAALAMVPRLALLPWLPMPEPGIPDEFSYILGAQTLVAGRLTNPTPPFWEHFENFHINVVPTYMSMYQPAPTVFYAIGLIVGKHPWWGVWLATGLMCGAICWALQPIVRPRYAFVAGLCCALKYGVFSSYSDSFWGGSIPALGGALTLGAFVRLTHCVTVRHMVLFVTGIAILANSRPFEGLLFALPVAVAFVIWVVNRRLLLRVLAPVGAMLLVLFAWMAYFNYRGTGDPLKMPYVANFEQYHFVRPFFGMGFRDFPKYNHYEIAKLFIDWEGRPGRMALTLNGAVYLTKNKYRTYYQDHFAPLMLLSLLGLWLAVRMRRSVALLAWTFLFVGAGLFAVVYWPLSSYPAPLLVSFFGLAMIGVRSLRGISLAGHKVGFYWARGLVIALLVFSLGMFWEGGRKGLKTSRKFPLPWNLERERVINQLERDGGKHLLLMKYHSDHIAYKDWAYNTPNIDQQLVIIARSMDVEKDCALINHYAGRRVWLVDPDRGYPWTILTPYESSPVAPNCKGTR